MKHPIEILMHEHRAIEGVLASLRAFAERDDRGGGQARARIGEFATFFREFADRCHHGKEEDLLFGELERRGMPAQHGPIGVMLAEHERGRALVREIAGAAAGGGELGAEDWERFRMAAMEFHSLLSAHIRKEDEILFPMAQRLLPPEVAADLSRRFEAFESEVMGEGVHEELHRLAAGLAREAAR